LKKKHQHIHRYLSILLLWVFAIALTPFSAFHNHKHEETSCAGHQKTCNHKLHVSNHSDDCLVCKAHFEKNYLKEQQYFPTYRAYTHARPYYTILSGTYVELIRRSLRGPPVV
jgi:hypothetical protein